MTLALLAVLLRSEVLHTLLPPIRYMTSESSFALLPAEMVRLVLECAARDSSQTAARLLRVSKLVHGWIQPIFYDILIISLSTYRKRVLEKLPAPYASCVRHVCITFPADIHPSPHLPALFYPSYLHVLRRTADLGPDIRRILDAAMHLSHLYIDITLPAAFSPTLTHLHCGSWEAWLCAGRHIASLASLTHLRIDVAYNTGNASSFACLLALTRLSHLAIALDSRSGPHELRSAAKFAQAMGTHGPFVVVSAWYCWASTSEGVRDAFRGMPGGKVCVLGMEGSPDRDMSVKEWEEEARGGKSIWSRANDVLRSQKE